MALKTRRLTEKVKTGAERRRFERITAPPMVVRNGDAVVVDVSEGGLCLQLKKPADERGAYYLTLTDGLFYLGHDLRAEVRWTYGQQVGLEWTNLTPDARVFLRNCFQRWSEERIPIWVEVYAS